MVAGDESWANRRNLALEQRGPMDSSRATGPSNSLMQGTNRLERLKTFINIGNGKEREDDLMPKTPRDCKTMRDALRRS